MFVEKYRSNHLEVHTFQSESTHLVGSLEKIKFAKKKNKFSAEKYNKLNSVSTSTQSIEK
jgi:hypothetical protein